MSPAPASRGPTGATLVLFAHNDDEFFVAPLLRRETAAGGRVLVAYLTFGSVYGADPTLRITESRRALEGMGIRPEDVLLTGLDAGIFDGELTGKVEPALQTLAAATQDMAIERILVPAWEGGHPDHDACHLVGVALAQSQRTAGTLYEYPTYNGRGLPWHFGRVMEFPDGDGDVQRSRISLWEGWWAIKCGLSYRSQRRTFVWILPGAMNKYLLARRSLLRKVPVDRDYRRPPHAGKLFYERRSSLTFQQFSESLRPFMTTHLERPPAVSPRAIDTFIAAPRQPAKRVTP